MKRIPLFALIILVGTLALTGLSSAFSPPVPFPVVVYAEMGGEPLPSHAVTVSIFDSDDGTRYAWDTFDTDSNGKILFDIGQIKNCPEYPAERACYSVGGRGYAGDNVEFKLVWEGLTYKETRNINDLSLKVGVPVDQLQVRIVDTEAPVKIVEVPIEVPTPSETPEPEIIEVPGEKEVVERIVEKPIILGSEISCSGDYTIIDGVCCLDEDSDGICDDLQHTDFNVVSAIFTSLVVLVLGYLGHKYGWAKGLMAAWQKKIKNAPPKKKMKVTKGAIKTAHTIISRDRKGRYAKK